MELLAAVQEACLVLAQHMVVVGVAVVGVPVVSAPGQPVHSHRIIQVLKKGHAISLSLQL